MTIVYRIKIEPLAEEALVDATQYIAEQSGTARAENWLRRMLEAIDRLETMPKTFGIWANKEGQSVYARLVRPYRIFYIIDDTLHTVHIIDIVHTARETKLRLYRDQNSSTDTK